jgi:hypothetical protein
MSKSSVWIGAEHFLASLRQARHSLKLQDQAQRYYSVIDIAAVRGPGQLFRDMAPSVPFPALSRQVTFDELARIGERR